MKLKLLLASAIAIVGIAVYTLTLSFTNTTPFLSQLEALASGEGGESGNIGGESGGSGNIGGESIGLYRMTVKTEFCQAFKWVCRPDVYGSYWTKIQIGSGPTHVNIIYCDLGPQSECTLESCTPDNPCDPPKPDK